MRRGCGYPKPGAVYVECIGEPGGTLPIIVVLDPAIPHSHFHRGYVYIDLDGLLNGREVKYVGSSVASAEEWHRRQKYRGIAQDVFGAEARIKNGQVLKFRDTAARILAQAGWEPGGPARMMQPKQILREHIVELAHLVEMPDHATPS
ncbi:MAG: hypothetical protein HY782_09765 [Chloroflexi bacterium]|nr:hypothetical protein [Chloroflexota bacterium]